MKLVLCTHHRSFTAWFLRFVMWSKWSHSAIYDEERCCVYDSTFIHGGVKKWSEKEFFANNPIFELRPADVPPERVPESRNWLENQLGKPYDWTALLGFISRRKWQEDDSWFCSELSEAFRALFGIPRFRFGSWLITPRHQDMIV